MDELLEQTATRIFGDLANSPEALWDALDQNGLTRIWVSEAGGGFDLSPEDGFGLIRLTGSSGANIALAETLMATWFLTEAGMKPPEGQMSIYLDGLQRGITFGDCAAYVVQISDRSVSLHSGPASGSLAAVGLDHLSEPLMVNDEAIATGQMPADSGFLFAALTRSAQICGALDAVLGRTIEFAEQREQFGRPISKFQAIQNLLSEMGVEAASASAALDTAVAKVKRGQPLDFPTIATAKYRACIAATIVSENSHQVHGAIGYTEEFGLARLTRRLWQWREDFGAEKHWANALGRAALTDAQPLWPKITDWYEK